MTAPSKVLIGPWNHSGPDCETPGPSLAREHLTVRWCDYWLKGIDNGIMDEPAINVYVQTFDVPDAYRTHTSGYWRTEPTFPIPGGCTRRLQLGGELTPDNPNMTRPRLRGVPVSAVRGHSERLVERGRALRPARRPARGRSLRGELHLRAIGRTAGDHRHGQGRGPRQFHGARDGVRGPALRRGAGRS